MSQPTPLEAAPVPDATSARPPGSPAALLPLFAAAVALAMAFLVVRSPQDLGATTIVEALIAGVAVAAVPRTVGRRVCGGVVAFAAVVAHVVLHGGGWVYTAAAAVLGVLAWLVVRERPGVSYAVALPTAFVATWGAYRATYYQNDGRDLWLVGAVASVVVAAWVAWAVGRSAEPRRARAEVVAAEARQRAVAQQVEELGQLQTAWESAHPGILMPPVAAAVPLAVDRTNPLAVMSLIFGIVGGLAAIPLGHTARSQIARTGERGKGLATAGLALGYLWLAGLAAFAVFVFALAR